ncbi:MAG: hypothetical protein ACI4K5_06205 [Ruminococcus sp.]
MKEKMKKEAFSRIKTLTENLNLNPKVYKYFKEGKLYYSYWAIEGIWGCIDKIDYDPRYAEAVNKIEKQLEILVYHVIETKIEDQTILSMLYVSPYEEDWDGEKPAGNYIYACVCDADSPNDYELGSIKLSSNNGALIRIG